MYYNIDMETIIIQTKKIKKVNKITNKIQEIEKKNRADTVMCVLFVKHTTACITTADLDPGTDLDMLDAFEAIMPKLPYRHPHNPSHAPDHIMSSLIGTSVAIPVSNNKLDLGTWQRVVLVELDGPREE